MTHTYIEKLIDDFFEGKTSNREEKILYDYFADGQYSEHLKSYAPIFDDLRDELPATVEPKNIKPKRRIRARTLPVTIAIAASIAFAVMLFLPKNKASPFEGSYIIVNGKKITNMEILMPTIEETLALVAEIKQDINIANEEILEQSEIHTYYLNHLK